MDILSRDVDELYERDMPDLDGYELHERDMSDLYERDYYDYLEARGGAVYQLKGPKDGKCKVTSSSRVTAGNTHEFINTISCEKDGKTCGNCGGFKKHHTQNTPCRCNGKKPWEEVERGKAGAGKVDGHAQNDENWRDVFAGGPKSAKKGGKR